MAAAPTFALEISRTSGTQTDFVTYINLLYQDVVTEEDLKSDDNDGIGTISEEVYYSELSEAGAEMRDHMKEREETFTIYYQSGSYDSTLAKSISAQAMIHTGVPTEGDYLKWQHAGWKSSISYYTSGGVTYITLTYTVTYYYTTREQERTVDEAVNNLLNNWI